MAELFFSADSDSSTPPRSSRENSVNALYRSTTKTAPACLSWPGFATLFGMEVNIHHVHAHLLKLIELAEHGEEVVIARGGEAVVKIVAVPSRPKRKMIGSARGKIWVFEDTSSPEMNNE